MDNTSKGIVEELLKCQISSSSNIVNTYKANSNCHQLRHMDTFSWGVVHL